MNWHDQSQWGCNANESPYKESHYDGINVDPLEVLFVKVRQVPPAAKHRVMGARQDARLAWVQCAPGLPSFGLVQRLQREWNHSSLPPTTTSTSHASRAACAMVGMSTVFCWQLSLPPGSRQVKEPLLQLRYSASLKAER